MPVGISDVDTGVDEKLVEVAILTVCQPRKVLLVVVVNIDAIHWLVLTGATVTAALANRTRLVIWAGTAAGVNPAAVAMTSVVVVISSNLQY
jgi:hypothetical protein